MLLVGLMRNQVCCVKIPQYIAELTHPLRTIHYSLHGFRRHEQGKEGAEGSQWQCFLYPRFQDRPALRSDGVPGTDKLDGGCESAVPWDCSNVNATDPIGPGKEVSFLLNYELHWNSNSHTGALPRLYTMTTRKLSFD